MNATKRARPRQKIRGTTSPTDDLRFQLIPLDRIEPDPRVSRGEIDKNQLRRLTRSLEQRGQIEPITVRRVGGLDKFLIVNGERRWRAAHDTTQIRALKCQVIDDPGEGGVLLRRLVENLARDDFPLLELGEMINRLMVMQGWSIETVAERLGVSIARVRRPLALLRLPPQIQEMVRKGEIPSSHALKIVNAPSDHQMMIANEVVKEGLSLEETAEMVSDYRTYAGDPPRVRWLRTRFPFPDGAAIVIIRPPEAGRDRIRSMVISLLYDIDTFR